MGPGGRQLHIYVWIFFYTSIMIEIASAANPDEKLPFCTAGKSKIDLTMVLCTPHGNGGRTGGN